MDSFLTINMDFFTEPYYIGGHFITDEWTSSTDFQAKSKIWIDVNAFIDRIKLARTRGCTIRDENQIIFSWRKMLAEKLVIPKKFTIINLSSHHGLYLKHDEKHYKSLRFKFHDFDYMIVPYIQDWVDSTIWVVPDYFDADMIREHLKHLNVEVRDGTYFINVSTNCQIKLKILKFREFHPADYQIKYTGLVLNPKMAKMNSSTVNMLTNYLSQY